MDFTTTQSYLNQLCHIYNDAFPTVSSTTPMNFKNQEPSYSSKYVLGRVKSYENFEIEISPYILVRMPTIIKIEVLNPEKVMRFTFSDETIIKTVCGKDDTFNFEFSFYLACAKYLYSKSLTPQGIEVKAKELMYNKGINKIVKKGMKIFKEQEKQKEKETKEKAEREAARKNKIAKKIAKKTKIKKARITEMTEAIKKANDR